MPLTLRSKEFFRNIAQIKFEGTETDNPLAFRWYDENKMVAGKKMKDHLRFACAYWHSFCGSGADPFGEPTHLFPWDEKPDAIERAKDKMDAAFEFITKMGLHYYCFHDVDVVDYTSDVKENDRRLQAMVAYAQQKQSASGVRLLWGTANLFSNRRYMNGAATNPGVHIHKCDLRARNNRPTLVAHGADKYARGRHLAISGQPGYREQGQAGEKARARCGVRRWRIRDTWFLHT